MCEVADTRKEGDRSKNGRTILKNVVKKGGSRDIILVWLSYNIYVCKIRELRALIK